MKTLSTSAIITDSNGYITDRGVTVVEHPETSDRCATIQINRTEHRADDLVISADKITSKLAGWDVAL